MIYLAIYAVPSAAVALVVALSLAFRRGRKVAESAKPEVEQGRILRSLVDHEKELQARYERGYQQGYDLGLLVGRAYAHRTYVVDLPTYQRIAEQQFLTEPPLRPLPGVVAQFVSEEL